MEQPSDVMEKSKSSITTDPFIQLATDIINQKHQLKQNRDIWVGSQWKCVNELTNDDVGGVGEEIINMYCKMVGIDSNINGIKTKKIGGGNGDGTIKGKTCEVKCARMGSDGSSFQHELGEVPWNSEFMIFVDISPTQLFITIFPNFTQEFYKISGTDSSNKCNPYFPTKSITWRKQMGNFKLDTTLKINKTSKYTFIFDKHTNDCSKFKQYVNSIIPSP